MAESIGHLTKRTFGYEARCAECSWKSSNANRQKVERTLRAHADRRRQVRANPEHVCDTPFWRTKDSRWECSECGRRYVWTTSVRTVPGVPASVCTVYENRWEVEP